MPRALASSSSSSRVFDLASLLGFVLSSRSCASAAFWSACACASFASRSASAFRSSCAPWRFSSSLPVRSPAACLIRPLILSSMPIQRALPGPEASIRAELCGLALGVAEGADRVPALILRGPIEDQDAVQVVELVLDHAGLETRRLDNAVAAVLVLGADPDVDRPLHVDEDAGDRQAALLGLLGVPARPLDLWVHQCDYRPIRADAVNEQLLGDADLRRSQANAERV